ncbi:MAG: hypothetical protein K2Y13_01290 [Burkholderiaceae bacterium]|uniref:Uncharacterized protein n=1 Tax=Herminiimonas contaminans TaxID=1111140 RepID=A0ABS0EXD1_9BURK|nr:DUF6352 family protein [Herminiimonas contaminans]MBF8179389.1 hypothetical protein [Herminiimonas contaminans]MBX9798068.1 hypothetical protein [Burkholderiaceae bacterium]
MAAPFRQNFWPHSGYQLTRRDVDGRLLLSDELLRAWWHRPEVAPIDESCAQERALHAALLAEPRRVVTDAEISALQDPDAQDNYRILLAWRDRLLAAPTLEAAYLDLFRAGSINVPPVFIDQLTQLIVQGMLDGSEEALQVRAAELFFRKQKVAIENGAVMLADADTVELHATGGNYGDIGRLLIEANTKPRRVELDVLDQENAETYWARNERHDTVISFAYGRAALTAFCRVVEKWIQHFYGVSVVVRPLRAIEAKHWAWHIGLDAEASAILNDLYAGVELEEERNRRILSLFQLDFVDPAVVRADVAGRPVYMACAMNAEELLRIKPQNLLLNLPLASIS